MRDFATDKCALCSRGRDKVPTLIVGLEGAVCSDCIDLCRDILNSGGGGSQHDFGIGPIDMDIRTLVCHANTRLPRLGLVAGHSGNVSGLNDAGDTVYIKPSGVDYDTLEPSHMVPASLKSGVVPEGHLKPSVDLPHHLYLYRNLPGVNAIVHTHSSWATAFAACHRPIPVVLTAIADVFGGEVPCAPYVDNEGDHIGEAILEHKTDAPAILLGNHGVFAWGATVNDALRVATVVEDVARTVALALRIGDPIPLSQIEVQKWHDRYQNRYGQ